MRAAREEVAAFLEDLRAWDRDPDLYQRDPALNRRITSRFYVLIQALVDVHRAVGPVYLTQDLLVQDPELMRRLSRFTQVPQGLAFELVEGREFVEPAEPVPRLAGLFDGTIAFEPDDVVRVKVAPVYVSMLVNRGRYLAAHGFRDRAAALYRQALALDPASVPARQSLDQIDAARGRDPG